MPPRHDLMLTASLALLVQLSVCQLPWPPSGVADPGQVVTAPGGTTVVTVLREGLFRVERRSHWFPEGDQRASFNVVNRRVSPLPIFSHRVDTATNTLNVSTTQASVTVNASASAHPHGGGADFHGGLTFHCKARGARLTSWAWSFGETPVFETDPAMNAEPINPRGLFVLNDSLTARLGDTPPDGQQVRWWEHPLRTRSAPPSPPPPAPDMCASPRPQHDVGPGATRAGALNGSLTEWSRWFPHEKTAPTVDSMPPLIGLQRLGLYRLICTCFATGMILQRGHCSWRQSPAHPRSCHSRPTVCGTLGAAFQSCTRKTPCSRRSSQGTVSVISLSTSSSLTSSGTAGVRGEDVGLGSLALCPVPSSTALLLHASFVDYQYIHAPSFSHTRRCLFPNMLGLVGGRFVGQNRLSESRATRGVFSRRDQRVRQPNQVDE
jgi:hypothetical protein